MVFSCIALLVSSCGDTGTGPGDEPGPYPEYMRDFVVDISDYADAVDPGFIVVPQNGQELLTTDLEPTGALVSYYAEAIDGQGREDLFFGYAADDQQTPEGETGWILQFLELAESNGVEAMVIDYCWTQWKVDSSYAWNEAEGFVSFAADHRDLDDIPGYPAEPWQANTDDVTTLGDAQNFLYLINDQCFASVDDFISALDATGYDMFVIDLFCCGEQLTSAHVQQLKTKPGGGSRLVLCYMSIGEAEDYRWYWQPEWESNPPSWLGPENPDWPGNYLVKYWYPDWQAIIFGSADSYLDRILAAGFDGVYLDKVDSYEEYI
ncbi:hypothetical protein GX411_08025 [Candidatus Fermentibacteria bacterium]|nr:hypothetical protein [Candidatus Fermentibacteria bacterium]